MTTQEICNQRGFMTIDEKIEKEFDKWIDGLHDGANIHRVAKMNRGSSRLAYLAAATPLMRENEDIKDALRWALDTLGVAIPMINPLSEIERTRLDQIMDYAELFSTKFALDKEEK